MLERFIHVKTIGFCLYFKLFCLCFENFRHLFFLNHQNYFVIFSHAQEVYPSTASIDDLYAFCKESHQSVSHKLLKS